MLLNKETREELFHKLTNLLAIKWVAIFFYILALRNFEPSKFIKNAGGILLILYFLVVMYMWDFIYGRVLLSLSILINIILLILEPTVGTAILSQILPPFIIILITLFIKLIYFSKKERLKRKIVRLIDSLESDLGNKQYFQLANRVKDLLSTKELKKMHSFLKVLENISKESKAVSEGYNQRVEKKISNYLKNGKRALHKEIVNKVMEPNILSTKLTDLKYYLLKDDIELYLNSLVSVEKEVNSLLNIVQISQIKASLLSLWELNSILSYYEQVSVIKAVYKKNKDYFDEISELKKEHLDNPLSKLDRHGF